jgi:hypothetical protein
MGCFGVIFNILLFFIITHSILTIIEYYSIKEIGEYVLIDRKQKIHINCFGDINKSNDLIIFIPDIQDQPINLYLNIQKKLLKNNKNSCYYDKPG